MYESSRKYAPEVAHCPHYDLAVLGATPEVHLPLASNDSSQAPSGFDFQHSTKLGVPGIYSGRVERFHRINSL